MYRALVSAFRLWLPISVAAGVIACGTAPPPREQSVAAAPAPARPAVPARDLCAPLDGQPAAPLPREYTGLARDARCEPELQAMMQEVSHALGVPCAYCHVSGDFTAMTERKRVANWMASEFVPSLQKRQGGEITCRDCHAGRAKFLGSPRRRDWAIEWMTRELGERFEAAGGGPLYCKTCHAGDLGSSAFQPRVILTDHLPRKPIAASSAAPSAAVPGDLTPSETLPSERTAP